MQPTIEKLWSEYQGRPTWKKALLIIVPIGLGLAVALWWLFSTFGDRGLAILKRYSDRSKVEADRELEAYEASRAEVEEERARVDAERDKRESERNDLYDQIDRATSSDDLLTIAAGLRERAEHVAAALDDNPYSGSIYGGKGGDE